jgi:Kef-type K+ transport system membrane component KefB
MIAVLIVLALGGLMHAARSFSADIGSAGTELAFGYLLLSAYFMGKIVSRFGLPKLTGYIATGVVAGPFVLGLVSMDMGASLKVVKGVAICILALTAGAELNFKKVRPILATLNSMVFFSVVVGMTVLAGALLLLRPLLPFFDQLNFVQSLAVCLTLGIALTAMSPAVLMAMVSEMKSDGPVTQVMLALVVVADLVVIIFYALGSAFAVATVGGGIDVMQTALAVGWELFGSIAFGLLIGMVIGAYLRSSTKGASLFAVMVCVVVAEIGSRVHLDPLIVMLAAGIWLENISKADAHALIGDFESAQLPVFLVFFALAGAQLDIYALSAVIVPVLIIAIVRGAVFYTGCRIACKRTNADAQVAKYAWYGMLPQAGLTLALAMLVQKTFPTFGVAAALILFGVGAVNQAVAPVMLRIVMLRTGEAGKRAAHDFAEH